MKKRIVVLGATGSIGRSTVDVVRANPESLEIVGLSAQRNEDALVALGAEFPGAALALSGGKARSGEVRFSGTKAIEELLSSAGADMVVNGIAGAAGLLPSLAALETGSDLALANKETVVMAWSLVAAAAGRAGKRIIPVDSEHSAVFHLVSAHGADCLEEIVLTASGGPFRTWSRERLASVTVADALSHPTWSMGGKISIDSATLANKGLEVIEAVRLFGVSANRVVVVVHPQSLVHSLIRTTDGSLYAQLSRPDMRVPLHNALFWPEGRQTPFGRLDLAGTTLTFEAPDGVAFPMLPLAYESARLGGLYTTAYNAADEVAVDAFCSRGLGFMDIPAVVQETLGSDWTGGDQTIDSILDGDRRARETAERAVRARLEDRC